MRITATQIAQWADKPEAKGLLPVLMRRLISATSAATELAIRGADSSNLPGWDGALNVTAGNAWVPVGQSRWEMGCAADVVSKARGDFETRTRQSGEKFAAGCEFIFVSPRRWAGKEKWRDEAAGRKHWRSVRAYDADDLEAWLEAAPGVNLWFGEELGLRGTGIEPIASYWNTWRRQTKVSLTANALGAGRESPVREFRDTLSKAPVLVVIEADSTEEAVAFACSQLLELGQVDSSACVTSPEGWRYVDANPALRILVAASPEIAVQRAPKDGSILIVPVNIGDRPDYFSPVAAQAASAQRVILERPDAGSFEKALVGLGEDESDAARLTRSTGRSWSVYRRIRAENPAISQPAWTRDPAVRCLTAVVLVGGWNDSKAGDVACIEAVTSKPYEDLERDLLHIARLDDSPVLKIGNVWKAKAPLELLHLFAPVLTRNELTRFFEAAQAILAKPDPSLELKPEQRWMASVYGKVREESGIVINSIADSLAKLSFYAENNGDQQIASGVHGLVRALLKDANGASWLSLSGILRELAEASPDIFLESVEAALHRHDTPIQQLFNETNGDPLFGRWWHTDLLWALETLAWSPKYFGKVASILAQLSEATLPPNLSNRPSNSLLSLFRPWWPQTTAAPARRLVALDRLIEFHNDAAWRLLAALIPKYGSSASANAKPHWRDDDAGAAGPNDPEGFGPYLGEIGARIVAQAQGVPIRIAELVASLDSFEGEFHEQIIRLVEASTAFTDEDRELIRGALRKYLSWHNSFNRNQGPTRAGADRLRPQFDLLAPGNLTIRHAWLFNHGWVEMPDGRDDEFEKAEVVREAMRAAALQEIFATSGWAGIEELVERTYASGIVGWQIASAAFPEAEVVAWTLKRFADAGSVFHDPVLSGLIHKMPPATRTPLLAQACAKLDSASAAAFTSAAPCNRETWTFLESQHSDMVEIYWQKVQPGVLIGADEDLRYLVDHLVAAGRHRTAFQAIHIGYEKVGGARVLAILEAINAGADSDGRLPDGWHIGEAMKAIAKAGVASRRQLATLEFRYFSALERSEFGTKNLFGEMLEDPSLFMEFICLVYRPHNRPRPDEPASASTEASAGLGWSVLHNGRGVPGYVEGVGIDREKFNAWVAEVRSLAIEQDRSAAADSSIGEWLSSCGGEPDGTWPCSPVRDLFEKAGTERIHSGFQNGVRNNRGVHSRAIGAGGDQERDLAAKYRAFAVPLQESHPQTAMILESIAKCYDADGRWHDDDGALWREGVR